MDDQAEEGGCRRPGGYVPDDGVDDDHTPEVAEDDKALSGEDNAMSEEARGSAEAGRARSECVMVPFQLGPRRGARGRNC